MERRGLDRARQGPAAADDAAAAAAREGGFDFPNSDPHNPSNTYTWGAGVTQTGTAFTTFLRQMNACHINMGHDPVAGGFAGHCDWRVPTVEEFRTLLRPGCPLLTICTPLELGTNVAGRGYWTAASATSATFAFAWSMNFGTGHEQADIKGLATFVRGVRRADL